MRLKAKIAAMALIAALVSAPACADTHVAIYVENDGRVIELYENAVDQLFGIEGAMMAIESREIITGDNRKRIRPEDDVVRVWQRDGDEWIIIHFKESGNAKRFRCSEVKMITVDRPWVSEPLVPSLLAPS